MKRRTFIFASITVIALIPIGEYSWKSFNSNPLIKPKELDRFCEEKEINDMGKEYRNQMPSEDRKDILTKLLLNNNGIVFKKSSNIPLEDFLDKKINEDFQSSKIIVLKGWIISITEARQCALFSMNYN